MKILLGAPAFIRIITFHRDGGGHFLETISARKVIKTSCSSNLWVRVVILKKLLVLRSPLKTINMVNSCFHARYQ